MNQGRAWEIIREWTAAAKAPVGDEAQQETLSQAIQTIPEPDAWALDDARNPTKAVILADDKIFVVDKPHDQVAALEAYPIASDRTSIRAELGPFEAATGAGGPGRHRTWLFDFGDDRRFEIVGFEATVEGEYDRGEALARDLAAKCGLIR